jgi:glucosamine-6-phosphate deaminase
MHVFIKKDYQELSRAAAAMVAAAIRERPDLVAALPTGGTPVGMFRELVRLHQTEGLDFSKARILNIDEYVPLGPDHPQSYYRYLQEFLYQNVNINYAHTFVPDVRAADLQAACAAYDQRIAGLGGIDLMVLGIGGDGHIGFNEPAAELSADTHVADLSAETIRDNSRFFETMAEVPRQAATMGAGVILQARKILLLASGRSKGAVVNRLLNQRTVTPRFPASLLLLHRDVTVMVDEAAAAAEIEGANEPTPVINERKLSG